MTINLKQWKRTYTIGRTEQAGLDDAISTMAFVVSSNNIAVDGQLLIPKLLGWSILLPYATFDSFSTMVSLNHRQPWPDGSHRHLHLECNSIHSPIVFLLRPFLRDGFLQYMLLLQGPCEALPCLDLDFLVGQL